MKFVYPEFFWAFGVLIIPILIHLFNFRKYKTLYFSSLKFIQRIDQQTKSIKKLKHFLVLLSRLLAFAALVFAFAQPYFPPADSDKQIGKNVLAIYLDNSFSMSMKGTEGELLSEGREIARKLIKKCPEETSILLVTNQMDGLEEKLCSKPDALERLDKISLFALRRDVGDILQWEKEILQKENETNQKIGLTQFVVLSDFQKKSSAFTKLLGNETDLFYPILLSPQSKANLSIDSIWFSTPIRKVKQNNELNVRIHNWSEQITTSELHVEIGNNKRDVFVEIPANTTLNTSINFTDNEAGLKSGKLSLNDKQCYFDDDLFVSYEVKETTNILIINGEDASPNIGLVYDLDDYYKVEEVNQKAFTQNLIIAKDLVILNGVNEIPSGLTTNLLTFNQNGGSLLLFPGTNLNLNSWNQAMKILDMPIFHTLETEGLKIKKVNFNTSFFETVFEKEPTKLSLPLIQKAYQLKNSKTVELIQLQNGQSLFSKSILGSPIYIFTSSLSKDFSSFTTNALFSTILLRCGELSNRPSPLYLTLGQDSKFPIYKAINQDESIHIKNKDIDFIPKTTKDGIITNIHLGGQEAIEKLKSGIYEVSGMEKISSLALNYPRLESDPTQLNATEITRILEQKGIKNIKTIEVSDTTDFRAIEIEKPHEYWKICILLGLFFILLEMTFIKFLK
jgi:hypothetical protein